MPLRKFLTWKRIPFQFYKLKGNLCNEYRTKFRDGPGGFNCAFVSGETDPFSMGDTAENLSKKSMKVFRRIVVKYWDEHTKNDIYF